MGSEEFIRVEKEKHRRKNRKMERKKEEVWKRLSRDFNCLKKLTNSQSICLAEPSECSDDSEDNGPYSTSAEPATSESRMRNPPKYLSARQVWLKKDLSVDNPYRKFFQNASNPKWHPPWRPPSPPSGWALHKAQVDTLIDDLAEWMKQELETPGIESSTSIDAESLRHMFELDLDGYAARKVKVQPTELRCLRIAEKPAKRNGKSNATPLPEFLNILFRVKQMVLNDISSASEEKQEHAFGRHLPHDHPKRGRGTGTSELSRWIVGRQAHPELSDWSHILGGLNNTFIGGAFFRYVKETFPDIPADTWPASRVVQEVCRRNRSKPKFPMQTEFMKRTLRSPAVNVNGQPELQAGDTSSTTFIGNFVGDGVLSYRD